MKDVGAGVVITTLFAPRFARARQVHANPFEVLAALEPKMHDYFGALCTLEPDKHMESTDAVIDELVFYNVNKARNRKKLRVEDEWSFCPALTKVSQITGGVSDMTAASGVVVTAQPNPVLRSGGDCPLSEAEKRMESLRIKIKRKAPKSIKFVVANVDGLNDMKYGNIAQTQTKFDIILLNETQLKTLGHLEHPGWQLFWEPCEGGRSNSNHGSGGVANWPSW